MDILGETLRKPINKELNDEVTRSYVVGLRFPGKNIVESRSSELFAHNIVLGYQKELYKKLSPDIVSQACDIVQENPRISGTKGSALLRRKLGDCSNLGESAYLPLLQTIKVMFQRQEKLQCFFEILENKPNELLSWFILGRAPYSEQLLQKKLICSHKYVVDMISGARRSLDKFLQANHHLNSPYPSLTLSDLKKALLRFKSVVETSITEQLSSGTIKAQTARQKAFLKKIARIEKYKESIFQLMMEWLKEWNFPKENTVRSRWRHLKILSRKFSNYLTEQGQPKTREDAYLSLFRGILITALLPHYDEGRFVTQLQVKGIIATDKLIAKPFSKIKPSYQQKLPLQLLMGSRYVIGRPGNSSQLTKIATETGEIGLQFWPYRHKKFLVEGKIRLHDSLQTFLKKGARINLLIITATDAPARKIKVNIVLSGKRELFFTKKEILADHKKFSTITAHPTPFNSTIGLDVNRLGEFMIIYSEECYNQLPEKLIKLINRYHSLERPVSELGLAITRKKKHCKKQPSKGAHIAWLKVKGELERVYARRYRLLKTVHQKTGSWITTVLYHSQARKLIIEDLKLSAKGKRGTLAKIILSMTDEIDLFEQVNLRVEWFTGNKQTLVLVDPRNTSQGEHVKCSNKIKGRIKRKGNEWDYASCNACGEQVNTHYNAAMIIKQQGIEYLTSNS